MCIRDSFSLDSTIESRINPRPWPFIVYRSRQQGAKERKREVLLGWREQKPTLAYRRDTSRNAPKGTRIWGERAEREVPVAALDMLSASYYLREIVRGDREEMLFPVADKLDLWQVRLRRGEQQRFETHTYISREAGTNPPPSGLSFTMGEGRVCRNVTIKTMMSTETHEEVRCLVDGEHEYNHTVTEEHSVEVVGYAESGVHDGAGGTTSFVVGMCTDALIRVTTTSAGGSSMTWSLDDGGHNGPWLFDSVGSVYEQEMCMFDNDFTLTKLSAPASWQGSVEVAGFIHYHNTITIPNDENWIVQGRVDPVSGLPSSLDGRLKSGMAVDRSHASIVLR